MDESIDVTEMLAAMRRGEPAAADRLIPVVYAELHRLAELQLSRERAGHTLQSTALANEAYLKLVDQTRVEWQSRSHFFAVAAQSIRRILIDHARAKGRIRRGGGLERRPFDEALEAPAAALWDGSSSPESPEDLLALDDGLQRLAEVDEARARVVELRFFGGLTHEEIAEVMQVSLSTVERHWRFARAWLYRELSGPASG